MAKTSAQTLVTDLAKRMDLDSGDATVRADMLRQMNISQKAIAQAHSLRFLLTSASLSLTTGASSIAVPSTIDDGKAMTLGRADGSGEIQYVPADEWFLVRLDTYGMPTQSAPTQYTIADVAGTLTFLFKPGNTTGGTIAIPYLAQKIAASMTDANDSYSVLPEGWEDTLLLDHAEGELRRFNNEPHWDAIHARADDMKERLYASYRTTKEQPMTDREQEERKVARVQLAEGA